MGMQLRILRIEFLCFLHMADAVRVAGKVGFISEGMQPGRMVWIEFDGAPSLRERGIMFVVPLKRSAEREMGERRRFVELHGLPGSHQRIGCRGNLW